MSSQRVVKDEHMDSLQHMQAELHRNGNGMYELVSEEVDVMGDDCCPVQRRRDKRGGKGSKGSLTCQRLVNPKYI